MPFEMQVVIFYAVLNGYFDAVALADIKATEERLINQLRDLHEDDVLAPLRTKRELAEEIETALKAALARFFN